MDDLLKDLVNLDEKDEMEKVDKLIGNNLKKSDSNNNLANTVITVTTVVGILTFRLVGVVFYFILVYYLYP